MCVRADSQYEHILIYFYDVYLKLISIQYIFVVFHYKYSLTNLFCVHLYLLLSQIYDITKIKYKSLHNKPSLYKYIIYIVRILYKEHI